jgi:signal transduction histidine kinase/DNA-binding response OmpR family regulator
LGFCLLVFLIIVGLTTIYKETYKTADNWGANASPELVQLNNTLAAMYQAESAMGLLSVSLNDSVKSQFDRLTYNAMRQIDTLKDVMKDKNIASRLDTLNLLLIYKKNNITDLVNFTKTMNDNLATRVRETMIFYRNDFEKQLINRAHTRTDTSFVVPKRKGILKRIGDAISNRQDSMMRVNSSTDYYIDSVIPMLLTDTVIQKDRIISRLTKQQSEKILNNIIIHRMELSRLNEDISQHINLIMNDVKEYEIQNRLNYLQNKNDSLRNITTYVAVIGALAFVIAFFFIVWTLAALNSEAKLKNRIQDSKRHVERLLKSREQLIYTVTHDIKAPISSIIGFLYLMANDRPKPSAKQQYYIGNMNSSAEHIMNLVRNLLDFHYLEKNMQTVRTIPFNPQTLVTQIYDSFKPAADQKFQKYVLNSALDDESEYLGDPMLIQQILNNLISNAIKYTPIKGRIEVKSSIEKHILRISVKDNGPGVSDSDKQRIFEEFTRLDETKEGNEGSGLGLAISQKLAILLGGKISIESEKKAGSNFILTLPLEEISAKMPMESETAPSPLLLSDDFEIMFIDDDAVQLNLISEWMKRLKIRFACCASSREALNLLKQRRFDIIFTDVQIPDIKGTELLSHIRNAGFENAASVPIIGFSAVSEYKDEAYGMFTDFIQKPFNINQLIDLIKKYAGKKLLADNTHNMSEKSQIQAGDMEFLLKINDTFFEELSANKEQLQTAYENNDTETVKYLAHKMLSLMKMISADEIVYILHDLEKGIIDDSNRILLFKLIDEKLEELKAKRSNARQNIIEDLLIIN